MPFISLLKAAIRLVYIAAQWPKGTRKAVFCTEAISFYLLLLSDIPKNKIKQNKTKKQPTNQMKDRLRSVL